LRTPERSFSASESSSQKTGREKTLEERHASLTRRLAAKQEQKSKYVKLYAQGHLDEEELEVHMADLKN
jgi:hypothetical protein